MWFAYKLVCDDDKFSKQIVVFRGENAAYEFDKAILKEYKYCKKVEKKPHFNKNLIMSEEKKNNFSRVALVGFVKNPLMMTMKK